MIWTIEPFGILSASSTPLTAWCGYLAAWNIILVYAVSENSYSLISTDYFVNFPIRKIDL